jgi:hypothetical protein
MLEFAPMPAGRFSFDDAWLYCATLTYNNNYDWRIPTEDEFCNYEEIDCDAFDQNDEGLKIAKVTHKICPVRTAD